ncbi:MAG: hypothetical protein KAY37_07805 [Phycisphaerae bacterium]|nr:hypothetical protein [Phycisphaerae bacterium]
MAQSTEQKLLSKIYGKGRGWAFSQKDFARLASRGATDIALHRLQAKGTIRRVMRGIYDYPRYSDLLETEMSPDIDQVAGAMARKFGWRIQPSGPAAQNLLGLSTQVPATYVYLSDGPDRSYDINGTTLTFKHTALKEAGFRYRESALIVQALKSRGADRIKPRTIAKIRKWLDPKLRERILTDTSTATGWVYAAVREICTEDGDG